MQVMFYVNCSIFLQKSLEFVVIRLTFMLQ